MSTRLHYTVYPAIVSARISIVSVVSNCIKVVLFYCDNNYTKIKAISLHVNTSLLVSMTSTKPKVRYNYDSCIHKMNGN